MRKLFFFSIAFVLFSIQLTAQDFFNEKNIDTTKNRIVVMHPTVNNIRNICNLVNNKIINVPNLEIIGVFHAYEAYDYMNSVSYLKNKPIPYFKLHKINHSINKDSLYMNNACSKEFHRIFQYSKAIIFLGGPDIPPSVYKEKTNLLTEITDPFRHYMELSFLFHLLGGSQDENFKPFLDEKPSYSVIGFCLGMQSMNLATGGTLYQDIPTEIYGINNVEDLLSEEKDNVHSNYWEKLDPNDDLFGGWMHHIKFTEGSFFVKTMNFDPAFTPLVYSAHHQCVKKIGKGFEIAATSMDGKVVEAIVHTKYKKVIGVQFHPEKYELYNPKLTCKISPKEKSVHINEIMIKENSIDFSQKLWNYFLHF